MKNIISETNRIKELMNLPSINEGKELDVFPVDGGFNIGYDEEWDNFNNPKGTSNSDFSKKPTNDKHPKGHFGVDIFGKKGTPIVAPVAGKVTTKKGDVSGNAVVIEDGDGYSHWLGHLDSVDVENGKLVMAGEKVGTMGNTGAEDTAPHLHYNVYKTSDGFYSSEDPINQLEKAIDKKPEDLDDKDISKLALLNDKLKKKLETFFDDEDEQDEKDIKDLEGESSEEDEGIIQYIVDKGSDFLKKVINSFN